jgi:hypothetical protein
LVGYLGGLSPCGELQANRWKEREPRKKRADHIVGGTNNALCFTLLGKGVGARHTKVDAMGEEERARVGVVKLTTVVTLNGLNGGAELSTCISKKWNKVGKVSDFSFMGNVHRKCE